MVTMQRENVTLENESIKKSLPKHDIYSSICEYIWNGFDAGAKEIHINLTKNELNRITSVSVVDDGSGIFYDELKSKFKKFRISDKNENKGPLIVHGKNGMGRFSFFVFSYFAKWETVYKNESDFFKYSIEMFEDSLNNYNYTKPTNTNETKTYTKVYFELKEDVELLLENLINFLKENFSIFLKVNTSKIFIDNKELLYNDMIVSEEKITKNLKVREKNKALSKDFNIIFISWKSNVKGFSEYNFFYKKEKKNILKTNFNRKSDSFIHTLIIESDFFSNYIFEKDKDNEMQIKLFENQELDRKLFKELIYFLEALIKKQRKKIRKENAKPIIKDYKTKQIFPKFTDEPWEKMKEKKLEEFVTEVYVLEPKIFSNLKDIQAKTLVNLLSLILFSKERDSLFSVLDSIVSLDEVEIKELKDILNRNSLESIIETIKMIENRYAVINCLKELVFRQDLNSYEVEHIQKVVENHFWLFGEEYNLVTSAEPSFRTALKEYWKCILEKENTKNLTHKDSLKEMDIFMSQRDVTNNRIRNIVVELKRPSVKISAKEYRQLEDYKELILQTPDFNANNEDWVFILIGREFSDDGFIERKYESAKMNGIQFLTEQGSNYKIFVKKWSELFSELEIRHNFINKNLILEKEKLLQNISKLDSDEISNIAVYENALI